MNKKRAPGVVSDINVTPMVDVMLVLLIIFMVITPMLSKGISVDKVKTKNPISMQAADKDDAILVAVTRDGKVYLGNTPMPADQLPPKVKDLLTNEEVLDVDQNSVESRELYRKDSTIIWVSQPKGNSMEWNIAFFNLNQDIHNISIDFAAIGIKQKCKIRDLWNKKDLGVFKKTFALQVNSHGAAIFRLTTL